MKYILASHGEYAEGLRSAVYQLTSAKEIYVCCAYVDEESIESKMAEIMRNDPEGEWIIFTDLLGGSVNQHMMKNFLKPNIHILTGMNLYMILSVLQLDSEDHLDEKLKQCVLEAQQQTVFVNDFIDERMNKV